MGKTKWSAWVYAGFAFGTDGGLPPVGATGIPWLWFWPGQGNLQVPEPRGCSFSSSHKTPVALFRALPFWSQSCETPPTSAPCGPHEMSGAGEEMAFTARTAALGDSDEKLEAQLTELARAFEEARSVTRPV